MIDEMTRSAMERPGPGHCGRDARPVVAVDIAYGDKDASFEEGRIGVKLVKHLPRHGIEDADVGPAAGPG